MHLIWKRLGLVYLAVLPMLLIFPQAALAIPPGGVCITCPQQTCYSGGGRVCGTACVYRPEPIGTACTAPKFGAGQCNQDHTCSVYGTVTPDLYIYAVYYPPPGAASTVNYTTTTILGSSTTNTNTWQDTLSVSATFGFSLIGNDVKITNTDSWGSSSATETDINVTTGTGYTVHGTADIVNHAYDEIAFWVTPLIDLDYTPSAGTLTWGFDATQPKTSVPYWVYVTWLTNPSTMPIDVYNFLEGAGITPTAYPSLLGADPFVATPYVPGQTMDPTRWDYVGDFDYIPLAQGLTSNPQTEALTRNVTTSTTATNTYSYSVGVSAETNLIFSSFSVGDTFTWGASSSQKDSISTSYGETITLQQPAYGYTGPTVIRVYVDKIWKTFFFAQDYK